MCKMGWWSAARRYRHPVLQLWTRFVAMNLSQYRCDVVLPTGSSGQRALPRFMSTEGDLCCLYNFSGLYRMKMFVKPAGSLTVNDYSSWLYGLPGLSRARNLSSLYVADDLAVKPDHLPLETVLQQCVQSCRVLSQHIPNIVVTVGRHGVVLARRAADVNLPFPTKRFPSPVLYAPSNMKSIMFLGQFIRILVTLHIVKLPISHVVNRLFKRNFVNRSNLSIFTRVWFGGICFSLFLYFLFFTLFFDRHHVRGYCTVVTCSLE